MSRGHNKITIVGNLGAEVDSSFTPSGSQVSKMSVGVNTGSGDYERTDWFNVEAWGKLAEICLQYLHKGSRVLFEGQMRKNTWQTDNGENRSSWILNAREMVMLDPPGEIQEREEETEVEDDAIPF